MAFKMNFTPASVRSAAALMQNLYNLFIPQIELKGLYQDGFLVSKSILQPITTLYSILFLFINLLSNE